MDFAAMDARLETLEEKLMEKFLDEADPDIATQKQRSWERTKAAANSTMQLVAKIVSYRSNLADRMAAGKPADDNRREQVQERMQEKEITVTQRLRTISGGRRHA